MKLFLAKEVFDIVLPGRSWAKASEEMFDRIWSSKDLLRER